MNKKTREKHEFIDDFIDSEWKCPDCDSSPPYCRECSALRAWIRSRAREKRIDAAPEGNAVINNS
jgi:hypothetical protein